MMMYELFCISDNDLLHLLFTLGQIERGILICLVYQSMGVGEPFWLRFFYLGLKLLNLSRDPLRVHSGRECVVALEHL